MTESVSWIDPYGVEHPLNVEGSLGRFMPPIRVIEDPTPIGAGSRIRNIRTTSRPLALDIYVLGDNIDEIRTQERALARAFDTTRAPGRLRNYANDGAVRDIVAYYESGLEGDDTPGPRASERHRRFQLTFRCPFPYWESLELFSVAWPVESEETLFFPLFPLRLGSSNVLGTTTVDVEGDVPVWPTWVVNGPGTNVTIKQLNTNDTIVWAGTLAAGDVLTIDLGEDRKSVTLNDSNAFASLTSYGFYQLNPGINDLSVSMDDTDTTSGISVFWRNGYLTP